MRRALIALLAAALGLTGCGSPGAGPADPAPGAQAAPTDPADPEPTVAGVAAFGKAPAGTASPSPTRRKPKAAAKPAAKPAPTPSRRPGKVAGPPPPAPEPDPPPPDQPCPYHEGTDASRSAVKSALVAAASTRVWSGRGMEPPDSEEITVPVNLMKAVAWQESGWQSTIIACDGGIGTMQIMPATEDWMNDRFGTSYDAHTLSGNTKIGAAYLEWLIYYFGHFYFADDFTPAATDPNCADVESPCLLNAVIAAYNFGYGAVEVDDRIVIPNPQYVGNVRALMTECKCLDF